MFALYWNKTPLRARRPSSRYAVNSRSTGAAMGGAVVGGVVGNQLGKDKK